MESEALTRASALTGLLDDSLVDTKLAIAVIQGLSTKVCQFVIFEHKRYT